MHVEELGLSQRFQQYVACLTHNANAASPVNMDITPTKFAHHNMNATFMKFLMVIIDSKCYGNTEQLI